MEIETGKREETRSHGKVVANAVEIKENGWLIFCKKYKNATQQKNQKGYGDGYQKN